MGCQKRRDWGPEVTVVRISKRVPEYNSWQNMKKRCLYPKSREYARYGARGITIHPPWVHSFETFLSDVGPKPTPQHSIDRIDNDGNYEPGNVRWATPKEQSANREITTRQTCPRGHPFSATNLYLYPDGRRSCRKCNAAANRVYRAQKKVSS